MTAPYDTSFVRRNGLTLVFLTLMFAALVGHALSGWRVERADRIEHGQAPPALVEYLGGGQFLSTLFENWESEFLQMGLFVLLTAHLRQKGAAESRKLDPAEEEAQKQASTPDRPLQEQPWPVRRGGVWRTVYSHSLSGALLALFVLSFVAHAYNSWRQHAEEELMHGSVAAGFGEHLLSAQFWFESLQNWQSEFMSVVALVLLSIVLREKDSTESKDVEAPHSETGT